MQVANVTGVSARPEVLIDLTSQRRELNESASLIEKIEDFATKQMKEISYLEFKGFVFLFMSCAILGSIGCDLYVNKRIANEFAFATAGQLMGHSAGVFSTTSLVNVQKTKTYFQVKAITHLFLSFTLLAVLGYNVYVNKKLPENVAVWGMGGYMAGVAAGIYNTLGIVSMKKDV